MYVEIRGQPRESFLRSSLSTLSFKTGFACWMPRAPWRSSWFCLSSARIITMSHHAWLSTCVLEFKLKTPELMYFMD